MSLHVIIPAGGPGSRLWPVSRVGKPKFLLDLLGEGCSLLQATVDRLSPLAASLTVVTGTDHAEAVASQNLNARLAASAKEQYQILEEPSRKNSLGAIAWAAARIQEKYGSVIAGSFAADHAIKSVAVFRGAVSAAVEAAREGKIVTIGIAPSCPSTAYGYICASDRELSPKNSQPRVFDVKSFKEKPSRSQAESYLAAGGYFWNAGMFVFNTEVFLSHLNNLLPRYYETIQEMVHVTSGTTDFTEVWESLPSYPIDTAIAEPIADEGGVAVVAADNFGWSDVGDFASLRLTIAGDAPQNSVVRGSGKTQLLASPGAFVDHGGTEKLVLLGIPNAVVIRRADVTLVTTTQYAQELGDVVAEQGDLQ